MPRAACMLTAALIACGGSSTESIRATPEEPYNEMALAGVYQLVDVNGGALPYAIGDTFSDLPDYFPPDSQSAASAQYTLDYAGGQRNATAVYVYRHRILRNQVWQGPYTVTFTSSGTYATHHDTTVITTVYDLGVDHNPRYGSANDTLWFTNTNEFVRKSVRTTLIAAYPLAWHFKR
jgi:hypothetical protein